jgi:hypothetical protein
MIFGKPLHKLDPFALWVRERPWEEEITNVARAESSVPWMDSDKMDRKAARPNIDFIHLGMENKKGE